MVGQLGANVHSVDAIKDVHAALVKFQERATTAMGDLRQKIDRTVAWLESDRPSYWADQERRTYDLVASTRVSLETCRMRTVAGRHSECIEEKKAYERAKMRMEYVREKQAVVRKWMVETGREANEYRARTSNFLRMLDNDVPLMIAQLTRMIDAIESYSETSSIKTPSTTNLASSVNTGETTNQETTGEAIPNSPDGQKSESADLGGNGLPVAEGQLEQTKHDSRTDRDD